MRGMHERLLNLPMIKKLAFTVVILFCFTNMKCESNDETIIDTSNLLIGHWSEAAYSENNITFKRMAVLPKDTYGISFERKGT